MTTGRGGSGLKYLGPENGKKKWEARLYWLDEKTGRERDMRRTFFATSKALALIHREQLLDEAKGSLKGERVKFERVVDEWLSTFKVKASRLSYGSRARKLKAKFGDWYLDAVTPREMQAYLDALPLTNVGNIRTALVSIFRHAKRRHYLEDNPAKLLERSPAPEVDEDAPAKSLTPAQVAVYFDDLELNEPTLYPLVFTQFLLGCRFAEVSALLIEHVDLETGLVRLKRGQYRGEVGKTKSKRSRVAGLPAEARELLHAHLANMAQEQWPGWQTLLFPKPVSGHKRTTDFWSSSTIDLKIRKSWARCGIAVKGTTHVARHTMISIADDINTSEALLREVVGHRSQKAHLGYKHPAVERVIGLADAVSAGLTGSRTGSKPDASARTTRKRRGK